MTPRPRGVRPGRHVAIALTAIFAVAACGSSATPVPASAPPSAAASASVAASALPSVAPSAPASAAAGQPVSGGTLTFARTADIFTFDPYNTQDDYSIFTELQVYERLVRLSADGKGVDPELATARLSFQLTGRAEMTAPGISDVRAGRPVRIVHPP